MSELGLGTLYDFNKAAMLNESKLNKKERKEKKEELSKYFLDNSDKKYFMLLCNELKYYTIFSFISKGKEQYETAAQDVFECLENWKDVLSVERTEDKTSYEIWVRDNNEVYAFYLFPYDAGVIEY
jgi:hypothetical protein